MKRAMSEDARAILAGGLLLGLGLVGTFASLGAPQAAENGSAATENAFAPWVAKPGSWMSNPGDAFVKDSESILLGIVGVFCTLAILMASLGRTATGPEAAPPGPLRFLTAFIALFLLATVAYVLTGQKVVKQYNLEYALWALAIGLIIANTVGTPRWLRPAVRGELYIKTGLVVLGAEVLLPKLLALGVPGIFVAWVVTPIVLITTYIIGQKIIKVASPSLNMVISADMSVCGVSAAIATAAACRAKREELSLAVGMSLCFTAVMMIVMPVVIRALGMSEVIGGAWLGGTIDSTGAVAAAGAVLGETGLQTAATVKMIQNVLIGVVAFGVAIYWVTCVEPQASGDASRGMGAGEIWRRFPKFVLGFVTASIAFSALHVFFSNGPELVTGTLGVTKTFRGWLFCLAFVCIGLETDFRVLRPMLRGSRPLILYVVGQTLNLVLTLAMVYLMFGIVFKDFVEANL